LTARQSIKVIETTTTNKNHCGVEVSVRPAARFARDLADMVMVCVLFQ
jgi:hypothetical protein